VFCSVMAWVCGRPQPRSRARTTRSSESAKTPDSVDTIRMNVALLGAHNRACPQVDKVDAIASGATYHVQVIDPRLCCARTES